MYTSKIVPCFLMAVLVLGLWGTAEGVPLSGQYSGEEKPVTMPQQSKQSFVIIYRPRPALVQSIISQSIPEREGKIIGEHLQYLRRLLNSGKLVLVGRTLAGNPEDFGIAVLTVKSEAEARSLMENDPVVRAGVFLAELRPFSLALLAGESYQSN